MKNTAILFSAIFLILACGCMESNTRSQTDTVKDETGSITGTVTVPVSQTWKDESGVEKTIVTPTPIRVDLSFARSASTHADTSGTTKTNLDATALAKTLGDAVNAAIKQAIPIAAPFLSSPAPQKGYGLEALIGSGLALATGISGAYAASKSSANKQLKEQVEFHKNDAAEGWSKAVKANPTENPT